MKAVALVLAMIALVSPLAAATRANSQECFCENAGAGDAYARALLDENDAVVIGRVESTFSQDSDPFLRSRVAIELIYKGDLMPLVIEVRSRLDEGPCALPSIANSGTHLIALKKEELGYSSGPCGFFVVNYYEPSQTVASVEHGPLVEALARLAPPHPPIIPTPPAALGSDIVYPDADGPSRAVMVPILVGVVTLIAGFVIGRFTGRSRA